jgi:hypothetical protein
MLVLVVVLGLVLVHGLDYGERRKCIPDLHLKNDVTGEVSVLSLYHDEVADWSASVDAVCAEKDCFSTDKVKEVVQAQLVRLGFGSDVVLGSTHALSASEPASRLPMRSKDVLAGWVRAASGLPAPPTGHLQSQLFLDHTVAPSSPGASAEGGVLLDTANMRDSHAEGGVGTAKDVHVDVQAEVAGLLVPARTGVASAAATELPWGGPGALASKIRHLFIVYQTRGVATGGTVALTDLHAHITALGYPTLLCNESNHQSLTCVDPPLSAVVLSGEWCHEVLSDYGVHHGFRGRGVQYHLGIPWSPAVARCIHARTLAGI